jgi:hypothetical protein
MTNDKGGRIALYSAVECIRSAFVIRPPRRTAAKAGALVICRVLAIDLPRVADLI